MTLYQKDQHQKPDELFEPGLISHLVPGAQGRMLDPRRTPVQVCALHLERGEFEVEITAFEDQGARWFLPLWEVSHLQFELGSIQAGPDQVATMEDLVKGFNQPMERSAAQDQRGETEAAALAAQAQAASWLKENSNFLKSGARLPDPKTRTSDANLFADFQGWLVECGCWDMDVAFTEQFVSNPYSGEMVKGHLLVLCEMGLIDFAGKVVRDQQLFEGDWSKAKRRHHLVSRLGFLRALFAILDLEQALLYRGMSFVGPLREERPRLISATFCEEIARSHYQADQKNHGAMLRQQVPVSRLLFTYLETPAFNRQYLEAEAVLLPSATKSFF